MKKTKTRDKHGTEGRYLLEPQKAHPRHKCLGISIAKSTTKSNKKTLTQGRMVNGIGSAYSYCLTTVARLVAKQCSTVTFFRQECFSLHKGVVDF